MANTSSTGEFLKGLVIGGAIGVVATLLMAPRSGEETRAQIREKSIEFRDKAQETYAEMMQEVEASAADLRVRFDELSAKVDEVIRQNRAALAGLAADVAKEIEPETEE